MEFSIEIVILLSMYKERERKKIKTHFPAVDFWSIEMDINNLIHLAISLVGLVGLLSSFSTHTQNYEGSNKAVLKIFS